MSFLENVKEIFTSEELLNANSFKATLIGDRACYMEGVKTILSYSPEEIKIGLKKGGIIIKGSGLYLKKYCDGDLAVCGKIICIEKI